MRIARPLVLVPALVALAGSHAQAAEASSDSQPHLDISPRAYEALPFDLSKVKGIGREKLSEEASALLARNGFVVVGPAHGSMPKCYMASARIPAFVTVDSVIEVYLQKFEESWARLERKQAARFAEVQVLLWKALLERWPKLPPSARTAGTRLLGLVAVGRSLAEPSWKVPAQVPEGIDEEALRAAWEADLARASRGEGTAASVLWQRNIDWSIYEPVGPYATDKRLARYFRASQWWGRQALRCAEPEERLCAAILAWIARDATEKAKSPGWRAEGPLATLRTIESTYDRFFDGPNYVPLWRVAEDLSKRGRLPEDLGTKELDRAFLDIFEEYPEPEVFAEWDPRDALVPERGKGKGVKLLPPRLTPAARIFGRVVVDLVRPLPRGLDLLAALGDERAQRLTLGAERGPDARRHLESEFGKFREEYLRAEYMVTMHRQRVRLQGNLRRLLLALARPPRDARLPLFMRTPAYRDRGMAAALSTWAGMREIYSSRVSGGMSVAGGVDLPGVAEPNIDAWLRFIELWHTTQVGFQVADVRFSSGSLRLAFIFLRIAEKQLRGEPLTASEKGIFPIRYFEILHSALYRGGRGIDHRTCVQFARTVFPDGSPGRTRWAGKAVCPIYVIVEYGGQLVLCKGGVFDYREFDMPWGRALTRVEFRKLMDSEDAPPPPEWTRSYRVESPASSPAAARP